MLVFTNAQIQNITKDIILIPVLINDPETGYIAQKNLVLQSKDSLEKTDLDQKVYSDLYISVIQAYHSELVLLDSNQRSNYLDSNIVEAGNQSGAHFPSSPPWVNLTPKKIDLNIGLPITVSPNKHTQNFIDETSDSLDIFKNGFNDGSEIGEAEVISATELESVDNYTLGSRFVISNNTTSFIAVIYSKSLISPYTYEFNVVAGTPFLGLADLSSQFSGFTDSQRAGLSSISPNEDLFNSFTTNINLSYANLKTHLNQILSLLQGNGDLAPRKAHIQSFIGLIQGHITAINTWEPLPTSGLGSKYTDAGLLPVETVLTDLGSQVNDRIVELGNDLGSITQASDGTFTSSGVYGDLFKVIDIRVARGTGSLTQVKQIDLGVTLFDKKISSANAQLDQYNNTFALTQISSDTVIGQAIFPVSDVTGFSNGDSVFVMDNNSLVYSRTINSITGLNIHLNLGIPVALTSTNLARIAKQK